MKYLLLLIGLLFICSCKNSQSQYWKISGEAMGTRYNITASNGDSEAIKISIEELLDGFNESLSTYIPFSNISQFNQETKPFSLALKDDPYFLPVLELSSEIYFNTNGAFDPTIMPLLEYYGFGSIRHPMGENVDLKKDSILQLIGFEKVSWEKKNGNLLIHKSNPGIQLNFNSIAKGYGVDLVAQLLEKEGVHNFLVEIGGEIRTKGVSSRKDEWKLGINTPHPDARLQEYLLTLKVSDVGMATSGNYRDFYTKDGRKYVHIIDPRSGENKESTLASATIIAQDCATADAYATACIVLGLEESIAIINELPEVEGCFITFDDGTYNLHFTEHFNQYINE
jgi:thiamine biosynthesis lipoprotein